MCHARQAGWDLTTNLSGVLPGFEALEQCVHLRVVVHLDEWLFGKRGKLLECLCIRAQPADFFRLVFSLVVDERDALESGVDRIQ
jgi:hypothetical protein